MSDICQMYIEHIFFKFDKLCICDLPKMFLLLFKNGCRKQLCVYGFCMAVPKLFKISLCNILKILYPIFHTIFLFLIHK